MSSLPLAMFRGGDEGGPAWQRGGRACRGAESHSGGFVGVLESGAASLPECVPGLGFATGLNPHVLIPLFSVQGTLSADLLGKALVQMFPSSNHFLHLGGGLRCGFFFFCLFW